LPPFCVVMTVVRLSVGGCPRKEHLLKNRDSCAAAGPKASKF